MTEQPPSAEAMKAVEDHISGTLWGHMCLPDELALLLDRFAERVCEQRVSAETERCANLCGPQAGEAWWSPDAMIVAGAIRNAIRAQAERPAPLQPLTEVLRNLPLNHASDDQIRAEYQRRGLAPASPAALTDYTERARVAISELVLCHGFGFHANCLEEAQKALAKRFSAVASERDAAIAFLREQAATPAGKGEP